ncbi:hypothetical protein FQZ97_909340 [compost metagenome]
MGRHAAVLAVAVGARAQEDDGGQRDPAAHGVHHHGAGEVVEDRARGRFDPGLHAEVAVPGDAFKEGVDEADDDGRCDQLRPELGAFGDAAGNDGRNGGREGQQEEELHQLVAVFLGQRLGAHEERGTVGHAVAHDEIGDGGDRKVHQDLDQGVDLVFLANRAQLQKGETRVHGQDHDAAEQDEQGICALFECVHENLRAEITCFGAF